jgi:hypothetical protein
MSKRQTRRSISIKGATYRRFKARCEAEGASVSGRLEEILAPHIEGFPDPSPRASYPTCRDDVTPDTVGSEDPDEGAPPPCVPEREHVEASDTATRSKPGSRPRATEDELEAMRAAAFDGSRFT